MADTRRMLDPSLGGDGVEALADLLGATEDGDAILGNHVRLDHRRCGEDADARLAEGLHQGTVFELRHHPRVGANALGGRGHRRTGSRRTGSADGVSS